MTAEEIAAITKARHEAQPPEIFAVLLFAGSTDRTYDQLLSELTGQTVNLQDGPVQICSVFMHKGQINARVSGEGARPLVGKDDIAITLTLEPSPAEPPSFWQRLFGGGQ